MRKTDINKYVGTPNPNAAVQQGGSGAKTAKSAVKIFFKTILTFITIFAIAGIIVLVSLFSFIMTMQNEGSNIDLNQLKLNYTSFIYVNDENGKPVEYQKLYSSENRVWVSYDKIPKAMKDAMVAIEDKRFFEHKGVDWFRTFGAVTTLFSSNKDKFGGSTLTQQLIKNVTGKNEVSLTRKVKEIFSALNVEKKYSKEQILEAYLNVVNYGSGCQGVQAAANLYFGKDISQCDIAECASIASITQSPYYYSPIISDETRKHNQERQQTVIQAMYEQGKISKVDYDKAMAESNHMVFAKKKTDSESDSSPVQNWYIDAMFNDVVADLQSIYDCSEDKAEYMMYHSGLKIYSAMDLKAQTIAENELKNGKNLPYDKKIQIGYYMMDYSGRVLATVGARGEKTGNRLFSNAIDAKRQPGSSIKAIGVYQTAIEQDKINYSTLEDDKPIEKYFPDGSAGPNNWYPGYKGKMTVEHALEISSNAVAAQICNTVGPNTIYKFLTDKLHFTHLNSKTDSVQIAAMAIGGMNGGVTVKEMTSGYQIFGNGGKYYKPYTYFYLEDHDGNIIKDNRKNVGSQVISSSTATIMHKLLRNVIYGADGTGSATAISGWDVFGKTGTTDSDKDSWFVGGTPYAVAGIWTGYTNPSRLYNTSAAKYLWRDIMKQYLQDKQRMSFTFDPNVISATYCTDTGKLAGEHCTHTAVGWYKKGELPALCDGVHPSSSSALESDEPSSNQQSSSSGSTSGSFMTSSGSSNYSPSSGTSSGTQSGSSSSKTSHSAAPNN